MTNAKYNHLSELEKGKVERNLRNKTDAELQSLSTFYKNILDNPELYNYKSFAYEYFSFSVAFIISIGKTTITLSELEETDKLRAVSPAIPRVKKSVLSDKAKKLMRIGNSEEEVAEDREEFIKQVIENYRNTRQVKNLNLNRKIQ